MSFIPVYCALTFAGGLTGMWALLHVPAVVAAVTAVVRALSGGFRRRWGFAGAAVAAATLWFVPEVLLWAHGPVLWRVAGTVLLLGIVTTGPSHDVVTTLVLPLCAVPVMVVMVVVAVVLTDSDARAQRRAVSP